MLALNLQNNDGSKFDVAKYQGKNGLLVVFFRGAWCNYCKKQLKEIQNHLSEFEQLATKVLALSCDSKLNSSLLKEFLKIDYPILSDADFKIIDAFSFRTVYKGKEVSKPAVILFNQDSVEVYRYVGKDFDDRIETEKLLAEIKNHETKFV